MLLKSEKQAIMKEYARLKAIPDLRKYRLQC